MEAGTIKPIIDRVPVIQDDVIIWSVVDGILTVAIVCGNVLTILAVRFSRRLRSLISSQFVLSLAISDLIVGLTLPYHLAFYTGSNLGEYKTWCMLRFFLIILACCGSIWNLIAIAIDRYIAICYPLHYTRIMTKKLAIALVSIGWLIGATVASIPLFHNNWHTARECEFDQVLRRWYVAGVITPCFSLIWISLLFVYMRIWREATRHTKHMRNTGIQDGSSDWKSVQVVIIVMGSFTICWLPYFFVACSQMFNFWENNSATLYKGVFSLAMANSGMNPIIYAWKNTHFRRAFSSLLKCKSPDRTDQSLRNLEVRSVSPERVYANRLQPPTINLVLSPATPITYRKTLTELDVAENTPNGQPRPSSLSDSIHSLNNSASSITNIITGNLIINNYNVYDNHLDVPKSSPSLSKSNSFCDNAKQFSTNIKDEANN